MEELLSCAVCCERYKENERHPVLLPRCGHSFCRPCVALLISSGCIICPTCRTDQRVDTADRLPTEYTLLGIINAQENAKLETCHQHNAKLSFWCHTCNQATCGECLFEDHPTHSHDVIRAARYISDMKEKAQDIVLKFMSALDDREQNFTKTIFNCARRISNAIRNVGGLRKDMEEARNLMKNIKEEESISSATSLSEAAKYLGLKWNIQEANFHLKKTEGKETAVKEEKEKASLKENDALEKDMNGGEKAKDEEKAKTEEKCKDDELSEMQSEKKPEKEKETKKLGLIRKSKTMSVIEPLTKDPELIDIKEKMEKEFDNKEKRKIEVEEKKQTEEKADELKKEALLAKEKSSEITNVLPRGRLARKALAAKKAQLRESETSGDKDEKTESSSKADASSPSSVSSLSSTSEEANKENPSDEPRDPIAVSENKSTEKPLTSDIAGKSNSTAEDGENANSKTEEKKQTTPQEDKEGNPGKAAEDDDEVPPVEGKLMDFLQVEGFMVCVEGAEGRLARLEWEPRGLHVYCHQFQQIHYDILIQSSILNAVIPSKSPTVFLEISIEDTVCGRVYIQLWGHLRRAYNFLALCLGHMGPSYQTTKFLQVYNTGQPGERILGGDYEYNNGRGGRGLMDDLEWNGDYSMPMEAGMLTAAGTGQSATNSLFLLCTQSDLTRNFSCPFGKVVSGMRTIRAAAAAVVTNGQAWITDCGVLLQPPH